MYRRIVLKSVIVRKKKFLIALLAIILGTSILAALLNIYMDLNTNIGKNLRSFGANIIMLPYSGQPLIADGSKTSSADSDKFINYKAVSLDSSSIKEYIYAYSPYIYGVSKVKAVDMVITGVDFDSIAKTNPWWKVNGSFPGKDDIKGSVIGINVAQRLNLKAGDEFEIEMPGVKEDKADTVSSASVAGEFEVAGEHKFLVNGIVKTNSSEDDQVFISLEAAQGIFGLKDKVSLIQVSALTSEKGIDDIIGIIEKQNTDVKVKSVSRISKAENVIQDKVQWLILLVVIVALAGTILCIMSTMINLVLERTKEIGIMKALGSSGKRIGALFYGEGILMGLVGGVTGGIIGLLLSQIISINVYGSQVSIRYWLILVAAVIGVLITVISSYLPIKRALSIDPVITLRGDE